jgi:thymidylate synthase
MNYLRDILKLIVRTGVFAERRGGRVKEVYYLQFALREDEYNLSSIEEAFPDFSEYIGRSRAEYLLSTYRNEIQRCIDELKRDPTSRRAYILTPDWYWAVDNPLDQYYHPPCVMAYVFQKNSLTNKLDLMVFMRSCDVNRALPYDIVAAAAFLNKVAEGTGLVKGDIIFSIANAHIYLEG